MGETTPSTPGPWSWAPHGAVSFAVEGPVYDSRPAGAEYRLVCVCLVGEVHERRLQQLREEIGRAALQGDHGRLERATTERSRILAGRDEALANANLIAAAPALAAAVRELLERLDSPEAAGALLDTDAAVADLRAALAAADGVQPRELACVLTAAAEARP